MAGYVTAVLAFVRAELRGRETSSFCDYWKVTKPVVSRLFWKPLNERGTIFFFFLPSGILAV